VLPSELDPLQRFGSCSLTVRLVQVGIFFWHLASAARSVRLILSCVLAGHGSAADCSGGVRLFCSGLPGPVSLVPDCSVGSPSRDSFHQSLELNSSARVFSFGGSVKGVCGLHCLVLGSRRARVAPQLDRCANWLVSVANSWNNRNQLLSTHSFSVLHSVACPGGTPKRIIKAAHKLCKVTWCGETRCSSFEWLGCFSAATRCSSKRCQLAVQSAAGAAGSAGSSTPAEGACAAPWQQVGNAGQLAMQFDQMLN